MESSLEFSNSLNSVSSLSSRWRIFKIILIGDSGVGKTSLTYRFCAGEFPERTEPTIGVDFRERCIDIEGEKIKLQLWDTAGQERFRKSMVQQYYRNVHAVLFVYDVTHPSSFRSLPAWVEECRQNSLGQDIPRFLVGNKSDLRDLRAEDQVSREQAHKFAETHGMTFFETSAKQPLRSRVGGRQPDQVDAVFQALGARLRRRRSAPLLSTGSYTATGSFKLPPKKKPEKGVWACTC